MKLNVENLIESSGLKRKDVAKEVGMSESNFAIMIKGETSSIKFDVLEKLCLLFKVRLEDILIMENSTSEVKERIYNGIYETLLKNDPSFKALSEFSRNEVVQRMIKNR